MSERRRESSKRSEPPVPVGSKGSRGVQLDVSGPTVRSRSCDKMV